MRGYVKLQIKLVTKMATNSYSKNRKAKMRSSSSKSLKSASSSTKRQGSLAQRSSTKKAGKRNVASIKFVASKTGRIVKSSPAKPNLSRESIKAAVRDYVNRDVGTGRFSD